jgi:hypothetical protein
VDGQHRIQWPIETSANVEHNARMYKKI